MPQAGAELTKRILGKYEDHGTAQACCHTLVEQHGTIKRGVMTLPVKGDPGFDAVPDEVWDAAQYLMEEWDYACHRPIRIEDLTPEEYQALRESLPAITCSFRRHNHE